MFAEVVQSLACKTSSDGAIVSSRLWSLNAARTIASIVAWVRLLIRLAQSDHAQVLVAQGTYYVRVNGTMFLCAVQTYQLINIDVIETFFRRNGFFSQKKNCSVHNHNT